MSKKEKSKLSLRTAIPKAFELNKKLIAVVGGVLGLVIVVSIIFSINTPKEKSSDVNSSELHSNASGKPLVLGNNLASYENAKEIKRKLGMDLPAKIIQQNDPELQQMVAQQRSQLEALQHQIENLQYAPKQEQKSAETDYSPMDREAMNAPIFFGGGAPRPIPQQQKDQEKVADKSASGKETTADQRSKFMEGGDTEKDITNQNTIQKTISDNVIMAGNAIPAVLQTQIVSDLPGTIVARVARDVYDSISGKSLLIPRGSTLIGVYNSQTVYGDSSVQVKFVRLMRPDGSSIILPNQPGMNASGVSGLSGTVDNHWGQLVWAAALTTLFNVPAVAAQVATQQNSTVCIKDENGNTNCTPNYGQVAQSAVLQSLGQTAQQIGGKMTDQAMNIKPTINIPSGKMFSVLVTKDIYIPPYGSSA